MARLSLNCSCGWNFFIPGTTGGHEVACPSCGQNVRIPGRKPGQSAPMTAGEIALEVQRKQSTTKAIIGAAVAAVIVIAVVAFFFVGGKSSSEDEGKTGDAKGGGSLTGLGSSSGSGTGGRQNPFHSGASSSSSSSEIDLPKIAPESPLYSAAQIQEMKHDVFANVWLINMATVLSECFRYRNLTNEWAQTQADIANYEGKIKRNLGELAKVGEKVILEPYLAQGDQIMGFAQRDFKTMKPAEAAQVLNTWVNNWRPGSALEQVNLLRGDKSMTIYMEFPEDTKELLVLTRHPALMAAGDPGSGFVGEVVAIPADVLASIKAGFEGLPPGYRSYLIPADRKRLEDLTASRRGASEDLDWLKTRILAESIPTFQREAEQVRSQVLALEPKLKENAATDVIYRKNGTKVEGQIVETTDAYVKIKTRFGAASIPKEEIQKIEKGKGSATEFPARYAEAKGNLEKLVPLLAWCTEKSLKLEKEYVAYNILTMDASNEKARSAVGLARPVIGAGVPPPPPSKITVIETTKSSAMEKTMDVIAGDVISRNQVFADVVQEMRRRTDTLTTTELPVAPEKAAKGVSVIQNPLTFDPSKLTVPNAVEIGTWWSQLTADERRQFAKYYGLWCAFTRGRK
jgi:hypothetical protein